MSRPQLGGAGWRPLFAPVRSGFNVNDHCVIRALDGRWQVFGITDPAPQVDPQATRWFCHGSGASLAAGNFTEHGRVIDFGRRAWAPTVAFNGEQWVMPYGPDIPRAAISDDPRLDHWQKVPCSVIGAPVGSVMRDGMILRLDEDTWPLYSTGKRGREGAISVCVSENLLDWRFVRFALRTTPEAPKQPPWGAAESPFDFGTYGGDEGEVAARLYAHALEYLVDPETGQWYITSAGWPGEAFGTVIPGSVAIRELEWME